MDSFFVTGQAVGGSLSRFGGLNLWKDKTRKLDKGSGKASERLLRCHWSVSGSLPVLVAHLGPGSGSVGCHPIPRKYDRFSL